MHHTFPRNRLIFFFSFRTPPTNILHWQAHHLHEDDEITGRVGSYTIKPRNKNDVRINWTVFSYLPAEPSSFFPLSLI